MSNDKGVIVMLDDLGESGKKELQVKEKIGKQEPFSISEEKPFFEGKNETGSHESAQGFPRRRHKENGWGI